MCQLGSGRGKSVGGLPGGRAVPKLRSRSGRGACSLVRRSELNSDGRMVADVESIVPEDDDQFRFRRCIEFMESSGAKVSPGSTWVDLGCNQGQFLRLLLRRYTIRAVGFDDWDAKLMRDSGWSYRTANLERELPWTEPVQFVSALEVIEHIVDTDAFLRRAYDIMESGGWIVITTPNINSLRNRITVPLGLYPVGPEYRNQIHHVRMYNAAALQAQLEATGFEGIQMRGVAFLPLSSRFGRSVLSQALANVCPALCSNLLAVARKP